MQPFIDQLAELQSAGRLKPFPRNPAYLVCDDGRVLRKDRTGWLAPHLSKLGNYPSVSLCADGKMRTWTIHRLIALTFLGNPPSPEHEVAHQDGKSINSNIDNIRWKTRVENQADRIAHGTSNRGERHGMAKLTNSQVSDIKNRLRSYQWGDGVRLANEFGVAPSRISMIKNSRTRNHV